MNDIEKGKPVVMGVNRSRGLGQWYLKLEEIEKYFNFDQTCTSS